MATITSNAQYDFEQEYKLLYPTRVETVQPAQQLYLEELISVEKLRYIVVVDPITVYDDQSNRQIKITLYNETVLMYLDEQLFLRHYFNNIKKIVYTTFISADYIRELYRKFINNCLTTQIIKLISNNFFKFKIIIEENLSRKIYHNLDFDGIKGRLRYLLKKYDIDIKESIYHACTIELFIKHDSELAAFNRIKTNVINSFVLLRRISRQ